MKVNEFLVNEGFDVTESETTYIEVKTIGFMLKEFARINCLEQRKICVKEYILTNGHNVEDNISAIEHAPEPEIE